MTPALLKPGDTQVGPTVLVVEDDADTRELWADVLRDAGYRILTARNGREALEILLREEHTPDVMVLDMLMPEMDGWQLHAAMKVKPRFSRIPILACSGSASTLYAAPVSRDYLLKPVRPVVLVTAVRRCLQAAQSGRW